MNLVDPDGCFALDNGNSIFWYENDFGVTEIIRFTDLEWMVLKSFHSDKAMFAAMQYFIDPSLKNFIRMMMKELAAQWTDPNLLVQGLTIAVSTIRPNPQRIQFGSNANQKYHTFRHVVQNTVLRDIENIASKMKPGLTLNREIMVKGRKLQYTVHMLNDGRLNVGRIHEK